jgi:DNA-binding NarL/FixJ family response regulator
MDGEPTGALYATAQMAVGAFAIQWRMRRTRVLIVDDHAGYRKALLAWMAHVGTVEAIGCTSDSEALAALATDTPDLVLVGMGPPALHNYDVVRRLRAQLKASRIVVMSLFRVPAADTVLRGAGADAIIPKGEVIGALPRLLAQFGRPAG